MTKKQKNYIKQQLIYALSLAKDKNSKCLAELQLRDLQGALKMLYITNDLTKESYVRLIKLTTTIEIKYNLYF